MEVDFVTVDVFTNERFGGNPLAVVPDARGLSGAAMQRIANEFNLAETTFVLPPNGPDNSAAVRIFTPRAELPFAGHPNIGTAFALAVQGEVFGRAVTDTLVFEQQAGLVRLDIQRSGGRVRGARLAAPQPLSVAAEVPADVVAEACSLGVGDLASDPHPPRIVSTGAPFVLARVHTRAALAGAAPRTEVFIAELPVELTTGIHLYLTGAPAPDDGHAEVQARMFAPLNGIPEDPATGSANLSLAGLLASLHPRRDLSLTATIAQGIDLGRPSVLHAEAHKREGEVTGMWIGGECVAVMRGKLDVGDAA